MVKERDCSLFGSVADIKEMLPQEKNSMYVAMIAIGEKELHPSELQPYDGSSIEGIRLTFHKKKSSRPLSGLELLWKRDTRFLCSRLELFFTVI